MSLKRSGRRVEDAWLGMDRLCIDMVESPEQVKALVERASADFEMVYDHFDAMLKARGQPSSSWMDIPSFGRMHIPSCGFAPLISPKLFHEYGLPILERKVQSMTHNLFHLDAKGGPALRHDPQCTRGPRHSVGAIHQDAPDSRCAGHHGPEQKRARAVHGSHGPRRPVPVGRHGERRGGISPAPQDRRVDWEVGCETRDGGGED